MLEVSRLRSQDDSRVVQEQSAVISSDVVGAEELGDSESCHVLGLKDSVISFRGKSVENREFPCRGVDCREQHDSDTHMPKQQLVYGIALWTWLGENKSLYPISPDVFHLRRTTRKDRDTGKKIRGKDRTHLYTYIT